LCSSRIIYSQIKELTHVCVKEMQVKRIHPDAVTPKRGSSGAVGYDLTSVEQVTIEPHRWAMIPTGITIRMPEGVYGRVAPRSGLALKNGIHVGAGVIDPDYTGEIKVILLNMDNKSFQVDKGSRIAQLILEKCEVPDIAEVVEFSNVYTERGDQGFGSTGLN
jgi:dUTP pyrophosphatase